MKAEAMKNDLMRFISIILLIAMLSVSPLAAAMASEAAPEEAIEETSEAANEPAAISDEPAPSEPEQPKQAPAEELTVTETAAEETTASQTAAAAVDGGANASGWMMIGGYWYYFDSYTHQAITNCGREINGKLYYFGADGAMWEGLRKVGNDYYYFNPGHGAALTGWQKINGIWYYFFYGDKTAAKNGFYDINGKWYYFNEDGQMQEGLRWINGQLYYLNPGHGAALTGWQKINGLWYYFDPSTKAALTSNCDKCVLINGKYYLFNENGVMQEGLREVYGNLYYFKPGHGGAVSGWVQMSNGWYYFDSIGFNAVKDSAILSANGLVYYLDANGLWRTTPGAVTAADGSKYIIQNDGTCFTGWYNGGYYGATTGKLLTGVWTIDGNTYYLDPDNGTIRSGWQEYNGDYYFFNYNTGTALKGWHIINDRYYYFSSTTGKMLTGWQTYNDYSYYMYTGNDGGERGVMATNTVIDGVTIGPDGKVLLGVQDAMVRTAQSYSSPTPYLILTDTVNCKVGVFTGSKGNWTLLYYWDCNCGAYGHDTPTGLYATGDKYYSFGNNVYTAYYGTSFLRIAGRAIWLFHSVLYIPGTNWLQDGRLGYHGSNGCVRLATSNAQWIYNNIPTGTTVVNY